MAAQFKIDSARAQTEALRSIAKSLELIAQRLDRPVSQVEKQFDEAEVSDLGLAVQYYCDDGTPLGEGHAMKRLEKKLKAMINEQQQRKEPPQ